MKLNKELINDSRLTPTMERVRSGRTQLFRERNKNDRSFVSDENCDVSLKNEKRSKYAELINGEWYWVEGCAECTGEERGAVSCYLECEQHDRCRDCNTNRKDITETPWGGVKGWQCQPCYRDQMSDIREEAFRKLDGEEPDCDYTDNIICPHCGSEIYDDDFHEDTDAECNICEGELSIEVSHSRVFITTIKGKRITQ